MFKLTFSIAVLMTALLVAAPPSIASTSKRPHSTAKSPHSSTIQSSSRRSTKTTKSSHSHGASPSPHASGRHGHGKRTVVAASHKLHGQQAIAPERVMQIQEALVREHYLNGVVDGEWNTETLLAMQKLQADHGWQTRLIPDARAIKTLGLGPDYSSAINANGASFAPPAPVTTIPAPQVEGFTDAAGVKK